MGRVAGGGTGASEQVAAFVRPRPVSSAGGPWWMVWFGRASITANQLIHTSMPWADVCSASSVAFRFFYSFLFFLPNFRGSWVTPQSRIRSGIHQNESIWSFFPWVMGHSRFFKREPMLFFFHCHIQLELNRADSREFCCKLIKKGNLSSVSWFLPQPIECSCPSFYWFDNITLTCYVKMNSAYTIIHRMAHFSLNFHELKATSGVFSQSVRGLPSSSCWRLFAFVSFEPTLSVSRSIVNRPAYKQIISVWISFLVTKFLKINSFEPHQEISRRSHPVLSE